MKEMDRVMKSYRNQLIRYAKDLNKAVMDEQKARKFGDGLKAQLGRYARDFKRVYNDLLKSYDDLKEAHMETIHRLAVAAEYRDEDTATHLKRMSSYTALIAKEMGWREKEVEQILYASPMHDVGKIGIPDDILFKPGKLTPEEFEVIMKHCSIGARILSGSKSEIIIMAEEIALTHHEKWNGKGYPQGLKGKNIPLTGRITAVADVFDALTTKRPYKSAFPNEKAFSIIRKERSRHFDPQVVDVFFQNRDEIVEIQQQLQEE
jgi:putative two-component system response regulator